jgi:hypothetical protein
MRVEPKRNSFGRFYVIYNGFQEKNRMHCNFMTEPVK